MSKHKKTREKAAPETVADYEDCIRRAPLASVVGALAFGYFLQFLPLRAILGGVVRVLIGLIKPALLIFGLLKLGCCLKDRCDRQG